MKRITTFLVFAAASTLGASPDATPSASRLTLTGPTAMLRSGVYRVALGAVEVDKEGVSWASVEVRKDDRDHGILSIVQRVKVGQTFGWNSKTGRGGPLGRVGGKLQELLEQRIPIEFDLQAKLISARQYPDWPVRRCHLVSFPDGFACADSRERRVRVPVNEIVFRDAGGLEVTLRSPSSSQKMPPDELCLVHGGRVPARRMTESEIKDATSRSLLHQADDLWMSRNPATRKAAQETYRKLLREFPSEADVQRNRDRIKSRSEAEIED